MTKREELVYRLLRIAAAITTVVILTLVYGCATSNRCGNQTEYIMWNDTFECGDGLMIVTPTGEVCGCIHEDPADGIQECRNGTEYVVISTNKCD